MSFTSRKKNIKMQRLLIYVTIIIIAAITAFVYLSPIFEKNSPKVSLDNNIFWNLKTPLKVQLSDDNEIQSYKITYNDGKAEQELKTKIISQSKGLITLNIIAPKIDRMAYPKDVVLNIEVSDTSKWNFFRGNVLKKQIDVKIDRKRPTANVINNSYLIRQGGSATVIVEVKDENLADFYISFNNDERFELIPFYKDNFYMAVIAWPIDIDDFNKVSIIAIDKAKNKTITKVPLYIKNLKKKIDKINISDKFINKVSKEVLSKSGYDIPDDQADTFVLTNRDLRKDNVNTIKTEVRKNMDMDKVSKFKLSAFKQMKNSQMFAGYGERRHYYYDKDKIDEAWHLGMDWASIKKAKIYSTNEGKVIFKDYLGIYGNTAIIDHGYGISTLYAHTSILNLELNDEISSNQLIANTGSTGAVFGDHLHFGVLIQGIEVNPLEWMDRKWIKTNVTNIMNQAKKVIDTK